MVSKPETASKNTPAIHISQRSANDIAVVTVVNGTYDRVICLLHSLNGSSSHPTEIVVVQNGSLGTMCETDTEDMLQNHSIHPVKFIYCGAATNVSRARNAGWRSTLSDLVFFLDDDNTVEEDTLERLVSFMDDNTLGAITPISYFGNTDHIWCAGIIRKPFSGRTIFIRELDCDALRPSWNTADLPNAACIRRNILSLLEGYDEYNLPMHREETDLACRIIATGFNIQVIRNAIVRHHTTVNTIKEEIEHIYDQGGPERMYLTARSRFIFARKHLKGIQLYSVLFMGNISWLLVISISIVRTNLPLSARYYLVRGLLAGAWKGLCWKLSDWPPNSRFKDDPPNRLSH